MANDDLLFKFRADGTEAVAEAKRVRAAIVNEAQGAARQFSTAGTTAGAAFGAGLRQSSADIQTGLVTSLKSAQREGDGLFNVLTQLRIGLTQIGRGDIGGVPNLIRAYREFTGVGSEAKRTVQVLDAALVASGASSTRAGDLMVEFGGRIKTALSGSGDEARRLRQDFETMGISLSDAVLRPEQAFTRLLRNFGSARQDSAQFNAGLNLLGTGLGSVEQAAGTAGRSMTQLSAGFGITAGAAVATAGALLIVIAAIAAVVIAVKLFVFAVNGIVDTAKQVGTKSKDDFEEFKKRVESAGFAVTQLDRNLSQGVVKALDQVRGASDGLFLQMVRQTGPDLITLLRSVAALLRDIAPLAEIAGRFISANFTAATAAVRTFQQILALARTDLLGFALAIGNLPFIAQLFSANISQAVKDAKTVTDSLPTALFSDKTKQAARETTTELEKQAGLAQVAAERARRLADERIGDAERLRDAEILNAENSAREQIAAERDVTQAKLAAIAARRAVLLTETEDQRKQAVELAKLEEQRQQAIADNEQKIQEIRERQAAAEEKAIERVRRAISEAIRLRNEELSINEDIARSQAERNRLRVEELARTPGQETAAITERRNALIAELEAEQSLFRQRIELERQEIENSTRTAEEKLALDSRLKALLEERESLHQNRLREIRQQAQIDLLQSGGFDQGQAEVIAGLEEMLGRQLTGWERLRVSIAAAAAAMRSQIPSGAAVATQSLLNLANAMAQNGVAALASAKTARQAFGAIVQAALEPLKQLAIAKASEQFAWALSDLAIGNYAGAAKHFAAGAAWTVLGGLVGAAGNAAAGSGSGGGPVGQQLSGTRQSENTIPTEDRIRFREGNRAGFAVQITLKTDRQQLVSDVESGTLQSFRNNGTVKQVLDNHQSGIPIG